MSEHPTPEHILQIGLGFWPSKVLLSAIEMGVFTELAHGAGAPRNSLRGRLGLHARAARDFLDTLVALGFLERQNGNYANTPATDLFLDRTEAFLHGRHSRDGQPPPLSLLGPPHRGSPHRHAAERSPHRRHSDVRSPLRRSRPA